jgi:histone H2A
MSGKGAKGLSGKGAKGTMGDKKGDKKKPISRSARAGLQFPVGRIHRLLKVRLHREHRRVDPLANLQEFFPITFK